MTNKMRTLGDVPPETVIDSDWIDDLIENECHLVDQLLHETGLYLPSELLNQYEGKTISDLLYETGYYG